MRIIADLHIHSLHSIATSPRLVPVWLDRWARIKGIDLLGTGDCTHPEWTRRLRTELDPAEPGLYVLKPELRAAFDRGEALAAELPIPQGIKPVSAPMKVSDPIHGQRGFSDTLRAPLTDPLSDSLRARQAPGAGDGIPRFVLTGEVSTIYRRDGKTRKVHHIVFLPDFEAALSFQSRLERVGTITSDGRPVLGIDSRDLYSLLLEADERSLLVPAHIWTPWFSALGERSGFNSIEECYGDYASRISAIETGLSSNPPMNWSVSSLDRFTIISNSDAHSPDKLGREATILDTELSFAGLSRVIGPAGGLGEGVLETVEFFPQEGKYHCDGHKACSVVLGPEESARLKGRCPVCGKALTPGVLGRVASLATRPVDDTAPCPPVYLGTNRRPYRQVVPLSEILGEILGTQAGSKKVAAAYRAVVEQAGSEFAILLDFPESAISSMRIQSVSGELLALAISRMRSGSVAISPGYDGEYGQIRTLPGPRDRPAILSWDGNPELHHPGEFAFTSSASTSRRGDGKSSQENSGKVSGGKSGDAAVRGSGTSRVAQEALFEFDLGPDFSGVGEGAGERSDAGLQLGEGAAGDSVIGVPALESGEGSGSGAVSGSEAGSGRGGGAGPEAAASGSAGVGEMDRWHPAQRAAILHGEGRALVLAGPGTGKTAVLAQRIARLVETGVDPASIVAITFTAKAAGELVERIGGADRSAAATPPGGVTGVSALTFHAFCRSLISGDTTCLGSSEEFGILPEPERVAILRSIAGSTVKGAKLGGYIESRKQWLAAPHGEYDPGLLVTASMLVPPSVDPDLELLYEKYEARLAGKKMLDFDDLVLRTVRLLESDRGLAERVRARYQHVCVDEYQDVNLAQYRLLQLLSGPEIPGSGDEDIKPAIKTPGVLTPSGRTAGPGYAPAPLGRSFFAIGDPDQSIYGFRGSDPRFIDALLRDWPDTKVYRLEQSYRCPDQVLEIADRVLRGTGRKFFGSPGSAEATTPGHDVQRLKGTATGVSLDCLRYPTGLAEAEGIARSIEQLVGGTGFFAMDSGSTSSRDVDPDHSVSPGDCAVLVRASALAAPIAKALTDHAIPCRVVGERPWWESGIAAKILDKLRTALSAHESRPGSPFLPDTRNHAGPEETTRIQRPESLHSLGSAGLVQALRDAATACAKEVMAGESSLQDKTSETPDVSEKRNRKYSSGLHLEIADVESKLILLASGRDSVGSFLDFLATAQPQDDLSLRAEKVGIMTVHAAKGLEFDHVFVAGLEEGILPFTLYDSGQEGKTQLPGKGAGKISVKNRSTPEEERIEEEARLLYVAMTRARMSLHLSSAARRGWGTRHLALPPSRFLSRFDDLVPEHVAGPAGPGNPQLDLFSR